MDATNITIVLSAGALGASPKDSALSTILRRIGVAAEKDPQAWAEKYGADHDGPIFKMHPFCWCERADCWWCESCDCPDPDPVRYVDGRAVADYEEWYAWSCALIGKVPSDLFEFGTPEFRAYDRKWKQLVAERDRRSWTIYPARVHACEPRGLMADRAEGREPGPPQSAPHFWFKPTGMKVWWYKYIGRDVKVHGQLPAGGLAEVERLCIESLRATPAGG